MLAKEAATADFKCYWENIGKTMKVLKKTVFLALQENLVAKSEIYLWIFHQYVYLLRSVLLLHITVFAED